MTKKEFVEAGMKALPVVLVDLTDYQCTVRTFERCFEQGYTFEDAVKYARYTEHVSPDIPEDVALKVLHEINRKYNPPKE